MIFRRERLVFSRRSLTGARIETGSPWEKIGRSVVAPSRERGSKQQVADGRDATGMSLPHGSADRNREMDEQLDDGGRSLPHGSAYRNGDEGAAALNKIKSLPYGSADRNSQEEGSSSGGSGRSLTGARIET